MGEQCRRLVKVIAGRTGEGMVDIRVDVGFGARLLLQRGDDRLTGVGLAELIQFSKMQDQTTAQAFQFRQGLLDAHPVVTDGAGHFRQATSGRRQAAR